MRSFLVPRVSLMLFSLVACASCAPRITLQLRPQQVSGTAVGEFVATVSGEPDSSQGATTATLRLLDLNGAELDKRRGVVGPGSQVELRVPLRSLRGETIQVSVQAEVRDSLTVKAEAVAEDTTTADNPGDDAGPQGNGQRNPGDGAGSQGHAPRNPGDGVGPHNTASSASDSPAGGAPRNPGDGTGPHNNAPKNPHDGIGPQGNAPRTPRDGIGPQGNAPRTPRDGIGPQGNAPRTPRDGIGPQGNAPRTPRDGIGPQGNAPRNPGDGIGPQCVQVCVRLPCRVRRCASTTPEQ